MRSYANGQRRSACGSVPSSMHWPRWTSATKKTLRYAERDHEERITYLRNLREIVRERGSENIVYVDESGFASSSYRSHAWAGRGQKAHGERSGNARPRTSLIAARRNRDFLAPMLFDGTAHTELVNHWFETQLIPLLRTASTIVWDNAAFHNKENLKAIAAMYGHHVIFLPKYSPDFNPIEQDFAILKKRRQFLPTETSIEQLVKTYDCYSE